MFATDTARSDAGLPKATLESPGWRRRLLLVDDHELVRYGAKALYTELLGVPLAVARGEQPARGARHLRPRKRYRCRPARPESLRLQGPAGFAPVRPGISASPDRGIQRDPGRVRDPPGARARRRRLRAQRRARGGDSRAPCRRCSGPRRGRPVPGSRRTRRSFHAWRRRRCTTASRSSGRVTSRSSNSSSPAATTRRSAIRCGSRSAPSRTTSLPAPRARRPLSGPSCQPVPLSASRPRAPRAPCRRREIPT